MSITMGMRDSSGISESYRGTGNNEKEYFNNDLIPKKIKEEKTFEFYINLKGLKVFFFILLAIDADSSPKDG